MARQTGSSALWPPDCGCNRVIMHIAPGTSKWEAGSWRVLSLSLHISSLYVVSQFTSSVGYGTHS